MSRQKSKIVFAFLYFIILIILPFIIRINFSHFIDKNINFYLGIFFYAVLFICSIFIFKQNILRDFNELKDNYKYYFKKIGLFFSILIVTMIAQIIMAIIISDFVIDNNNQKTVEEYRSVNFIVSCISTIIIGPFVEEIMFRLILFKDLLKVNPIMSYVVTGIIFGFLHCMNALFKGDINQLLLIFVYIVPCTGFNYIFQKTNNMLISYIFHSVYNMIPVAVKFLL